MLHFRNVILEAFGQRMSPVRDLFGLGK